MFCISLGSTDGDDNNLFDDPMRELFLFAVLLNRQDMARLFWEEGKEAIASSLVASKILKAMAEEAGEDSDLGKELAVHARYE